MDQINNEQEVKCGNCDICRNLIPKEHVKVECQIFCQDKEFYEKMEQQPDKKYLIHEWHAVNIGDKDIKLLCANCGKIEKGLLSAHKMRDNNRQNNAEKFNKRV